MYLSKESTEELEAFRRFTMRHGATLRLSLAAYADTMDKLAEESEGQYAAGQSDRTVMAQQSENVISNEGWRQIADRANGAASQARKAAEELGRLTGEALEEEESEE